MSLHTGITSIFLIDILGGQMSQPARRWLPALILLLGLLLSGCASELISPEEMRVQEAASTEVANVLFDKDMDTTASFNVRRDGHVVIKFDSSVPFDRYNDVVQLLRSKKAIPSLYAEQGGREVCPMTPP
jgi:starvation-inducible outer membrane lipoprotein